MRMSWNSSVVNIAVETLNNGVALTGDTFQ
jgi:hypothetical protein